MEGEDKRFPISQMKKRITSDFLQNARGLGKRLKDTLLTSWVEVSI
jgi:hypothetical protein